MQLIVGDKRVNVTMKAKGAMIVIIALKGEGLLKAGLPTSLYRLWNQPAHCARSGEHVEDYESMFGNMMNCLNILTV